MIRPRLLPAVVGALLALAPAAHAAVGTGRTIVKLKAGVARIQVADVAASIDGQVVRHAAGSPYVLIAPRSGSARLSLAKLPREIEFTDPEILMSNRGEASSLQGPSVPNDPRFPDQWGLQDTGFGIHLPSARARTRGAGVTVAVIDTGIRQDLPDLAGTTFVPGYNAIANNDRTADDNGHGSHVAGTIAQTTDNRLGCAGIAPAAKIMPVKVLDRNGSGSNYSIAVGLQWAADHGAQVANLSLGGGASRTLQDAMATCDRKGMTIVCATGNNGRASILYPAAYPQAIAVGASTRQGTRAPFSNYGAGLSLVAPGEDILQQTIDKATGRPAYYYYDGTSMATPHVTGVCALVKSLNPSLTPTAIRQLLTRTARDLGAPGPDREFGAGLLDAAAAVAAAGGAPAPAPVPTPSPCPPAPTPTPAPGPAPSLPPAPAPSSEAQQVLDLVNVERAKAGAAPLAFHDALMRAAQAHSEDQAAHNQMSHTGSDGSNLGQRLTRVGYPFRTWGENVAYGYATPVAVMQGWLASPGHRANILNPNFNEIGIGIARNARGVPYYTQDFGAR
jgi:serine protease